MASLVAIGSAISSVASVAAPVLAVGGTLLSMQQSNAQADAAYSAGVAQNNVAIANAQVLEQNAQTEQALGARRAEEELRQKNIAISRARAVGGGDQDYELISDIEEEGQLRSSLAIWEGSERAAGIQDQANIQRYQGATAVNAGMQEAKAYKLKGTTTLLGGANSFLSKYG